MQLLYMRSFSFALYDSAETILGALIISVFFPHYIVRHFPSWFYGLALSLAFLLSFFLALFLGERADHLAKRKLYFVYSSLGVVVCCAALSCTTLIFPLLSLGCFLLLVALHQQALVFYYTLLASFTAMGWVSGFGVALGYVGSAIANIWLQELFKPPWVYLEVAAIFLLLSLPAIIALPNPLGQTRKSAREIMQDRAFLWFMLSLMALSEVANTLTLMMAIYLQKVYGLEISAIRTIIGSAALGGVVGGLFFGMLCERLGAAKVFPWSFILWALLFLFLPWTPNTLLLPLGLAFGAGLSLIGTSARVFILERYGTTEAAMRMSFFSLTERIASSVGLGLFSLLLWFTGENYRFCGGLLVLFPLAGIFCFLRFQKLASKKPV